MTGRRAGVATAAQVAVAPIRCPSTERRPSTRSNVPSSAWRVASCATTSTGTRSRSRGARRPALLVPAGDPQPTTRPVSPDHARCVRRLAARGRADIEHAVPRLRVERADDERGRLILHGEPTLCESAQPGGIPTVEKDNVRMQPRGLGRVTARSESADERLDGGRTRVDPETQETRAPRTPPQRPLLRRRRGAGGAPSPPTAPSPCESEIGVVGRTRRSRRRVVGQPPEDRVHEAALAGRGEVDRRRHRRVRGYPHEQQLIRAESERGTSAGAHACQGTRGPESDRAIQPGKVTKRPQRELGGEAPVARVQARAFEQRGKYPRGVRVLIGHSPHGLHRDRPRRRHVPNRSVARSRTPRAQSAAGIRRRPGAATSRSRTVPSPAATTTPSRSAPRMVPGSPPRCSTPSARRSLEIVPPPGRVRSRFGANARTRRTTSSADRRQSMCRSAGPSLGANVAAASSCGIGSPCPRRELRSELREQPGADRWRAARRGTRHHRPGGRLLAARQHRPGVQAFVHAHHGDARDGVAFEDRVLDRTRAAPTGKQREMQVHRAEARRVEHAGAGAALRTPRRRTHRVRASAIASGIARRGRRLDLDERKPQPDGRRPRPVWT